MFSSIDRITAENREKSQQLQNLAQKYVFLRTEVILSMDEYNFDQAPQDIKKEEFQLERDYLQKSGGRGSRVGKIVAGLVTSSRLVPLKTRRVGARCTDEAHFWLNGYVIKQNYSIWSEANPQVYVETPLHPEKLTVSCPLWAGGILLQKR
ncbi:hypothetical protein TNCV_4418521 [Trichonephila clavipes]|nr:hypothetical protein TNCV_4418521 [Trichonephila clavipes]